MYNLQIAKRAVTAFTKSGTVPDVRGKLHYCKKGGSKLKWQQENFVLQKSGIFSITGVSSFQEIEFAAISFSPSPSPIDPVMYIL